MWDKVQMIRSNKRRPTKCSPESMFSGLFYSADCGTKLGLSAANGNLFFRYSCCQGNSRGKECTQHYIREDVFYQLVLKRLQQFLPYLRQFGRTFIKQQIDVTFAERGRNLSAMQKRLKELDRLFQRIYEDNVAKLITVSKKYTCIEALVSEILNTFVDKIVVHERMKKDEKRTQAIDIPMSGLWTSPPMKNCEKWNRSICPRLASNRLISGVGRRQFGIMPIHISFYPYWV